MKPEEGKKRKLEIITHIRRLYRESDRMILCIALRRLLRCLKLIITSGFQFSE